ncbi:MAG: DUF892 family protein [Solirubrobacteraceae bacterium]
MFERLNTPQEAYNYKLGAALRMEQEVLEILDSNIKEAKDDEVRQLFERHRLESEGHVVNLEQVFELFGWKADDSPCPAIQGLEKEGSANAKKTDDSLLDSVLLQSAVEVEHHEIGVYENLIINARAMGREDVVRVLERNLEQEAQALQLAKTTQERVAAVTRKAA